MGNCNVCVQPRVWKSLSGHEANYREWRVSRREGLLTTSLCERERSNGRSTYALIMAFLGYRWDNTILQHCQETGSLVRVRQLLRNTVSRQYLKVTF